MADTQFLIESDSPAQPDLLFWQLLGVESFSRPSRYLLAVLSRKRQINPDDVLGKSFTVVMEFHDEGQAKHKRRYQGYATRMCRVGDTSERLCMYHIELDSWFGLLRHRSNARIFQEKKFDEVIKDVLQDSKIRTVENVDYAGLREKHLPRRYCVQYQETDFDFLSRLMELEGVYYWFDNAGPGDGKKMVLADNVSVHEKLPVETEMVYAPEGTSGETRFNEIEEWWSERALQTGRMELADRDFKKIRSKIAHKVEFPAHHDHADYEVFEFPGGFFDKEAAQSTADLRAEEQMTRSEACWAATRWPDVAVGRVFKLTGHTDAALNQEWLLTRCLLVLSHPGYEAVDVDTAAHDALVAQFAAQATAPLGLWPGIDRRLAQLTQSRASHAYLIEVIPANTTFRPPRVTPRLQMGSPHTAIVVGPAGEEIHMDDFGRVKVQFHWDRYGKSDEKSTAWIRVSQPWAGQDWGGQFIPRMGQEVIVDFLYGDPDRPIIVGRVYNDDQPIPYKAATQSGFKSRSTPGGGPDNYNEIMFEDKKGDELLSLHAEKNMSTSVENDDSTHVGRDQSLVVKRDQVERVERDRTVFITRDDRSVVDGGQTQTVAKNHTHHVVGNQTNAVDGDHKLTVLGAATADVSGHRSDISRSGETRNVLGNQTTSVTGNVAFKAANIKFEAGHFDFIVTGGNSTVVTSPTGPYSILANGIKLVSNTSVDTFSVGDINDVSIGSNQTVLGSNSSGYMGSSSESNLGIARSTFMGMALDNAIALSMQNFLGVNIENTAAVKLENCAAIGIEMKAGEMHNSGLFTVTPGAGAAAGGGAATAGMGASIAGAASSAAALVAGLIFTVKDTIATYDQYKTAAGQLRSAAEAAHDAGLHGLERRLNALAGVADSRATEVAATAGHNIVPGLGSLGAILTEMTGDEGLTGSSRVDQLNSENPSSAEGPPPGSGPSGGSGRA